MEQIILDRLNETNRSLPLMFKKDRFTLDNAYDLIRMSKNISPAGGRPATLKALKRLVKKKQIALNGDKITWCFNSGKM
jgi:hypothetical protein